MQRPKENPINAGISGLLRLFQLKSNEMMVYNTLTKKPMTIRQLQNSTKMSERSLRTHLDGLVRKNFVRRRLVEDKHLKYVYYASPGESLLDMIKRHIEEIEKNRLRRKEDIIRGTEASLPK